MPPLSKGRATRLRAPKNVMVPRLLMSLASAAALIGCGAGRPLGNEGVAPELIFDRFEFRVYRGPELEASGVARRAAFRRDSSDLWADQLSVAFPARPGRAEARFEAGQATGNVRERRFEAAGGVRGTQAGQVATTERARYARADGLVRGDQPVEVRGPAYTLAGPGFALDPRDGVMRVEGGARVVAGAGAGTKR